MSKKCWLLVLIIGVVACGVGMGFLLKLDLYRQKYNEFEDRGVPRINITLNGVSLEEINAGLKETKYEGNELTLYNDGVITDFENVEVRGRGNATWEWIPDKKPFRLKFDDKVDLFGLGKAKKWILLANHMDDTNLRNDISFYLAGMLAMKYSYEGQFVELYIDDQYRGLYYLMRSMEISKTTVDLRNQFGVLVELDNIYGDLEEYHRKSSRDDVLVAKDCVSKDNIENSFDMFMDEYNRFEEALEDRDYELISEIVDVESFAQYYLLNEFTVNPDAYWTSFYFYKDGSDSKIYAGPGWDFDFALANKGWANWLGEQFYSPTETMVRKVELMPEEFYTENDLSFEDYDASTKISRMMYDLMELPEFQDVVKDVFRRTLDGRKDELMQYVDQQIELINEAAIKNENLWGRKSYDREVARLRDWIMARYDYMENIYK